MKRSVEFFSVLPTISWLMGKDHNNSRNILNATKFQFSQKYRLPFIKNFSVVPCYQATSMVLQELKGQELGKKFDMLSSWRMYILLLMWILQEMTALGVGLGSVHANHHPRVTTHCGVNQVPTVVGVVSGQVIHFHGNLRGSTPYKTSSTSSHTTWFHQLVHMHSVYA